MENKSIALILYGQIINIDHLIVRLEYYKKYIQNIILITFEISVINHKEKLLQYIDQNNLILIPSNKTGKNINNKVKITPFTITQPDYYFYYDSSWYKKYIDYKTKTINNLSAVYKYFKIYGKKYDYYLLLRNDFDMSLNKNIIEEMLEKGKNKIVLNSCRLTKEKPRIKNGKPKKVRELCDTNENFLLTHSLDWPDQTHMVVHACAYIFFSDYSRLYNFLDILLNNNNYNFRIFPKQCESWLFCRFLLLKENIKQHVKPDKLEKLMYKYFDFISNKKDKNRICFYLNRTFIQNKTNINFSKESTYPCIYCKKKNIFENDSICSYK